MSQEFEGKNQNGPVSQQDQSSSDAHVPMPFPTLPEYIEQSIPPPSYEEIMGHQTQSSVHQEPISPDLPPLAYIDIMPRLLEPGNIKYKLAPKFDKFSYVIAVANEWLKNNAGYAVWKCETVESKAEASVTAGGPPFVDLDKMTIHHSTYGFNVFVRGVRMWLVKKTDRGPPQQLGLMNVVPEKKLVDYSTISSGGLFMFEDPYYRNMRRTHHMITYDSMTETITKLNSKLKASPLPGTILNVESAMMKTFEFADDTDVDPDNTCYTSQHKMKRLTQILRIFYLLGSPAHEEIHLQEFQPYLIKPPTGFGEPQWQSWAELNGQLGGWLANTHGIRVVNIQAFNARYKLILQKVNIMADCTDEVQTSSTIRQYVKILRVFFTTGSPIQSQQIANFSSRLFLPVRLGRSKFEGMAQTMYRIEAWLRLLGIPIYNVETVQYILQEFKPLGVELDKCSWNENPSIGNAFVTAIRVYFPCTFNEPDLRLLPPQPIYDPSFTPGGGECCNIC